MKVSEEMYGFLDGVEFSNNMQIVFCEEGKKNRLTRIETLENLVKDKKIIHVGACDHLPLINNKIEQNTWLHKRLQGVANAIIGIDIDEQAVKYTNEIGYQDIFYYNILSPTGGELITKMNEISEEQWDYILLGEMLEHVDNPVEFLRTVRDNCKGKIKEIIVTVPNAFAYNNVHLLQKNMELNNSDHKFLFTPYTILKVLSRAGMRPTDIIFAGYPSLRRKIVFPYLKREIMALSLVAVAQL